MGRRDPDDDYVLSFDRRGYDYNLAGEICPMAREAERAALLERARLDRAQRLVDVPAGGGYVAHGVRARLAGDAEIICIKPSTRFGAGLRDAFTVYHEPMHAVFLPPDDTCRSNTDDGIQLNWQLQYAVATRPLPD